MTVRSKRASMRSERPQSVTWRSGSRPGRCGRRSSSGRRVRAGRRSPGASVVVVRASSGIPRHSAKVKSMAVPAPSLAASARATDVDGYGARGHEEWLDVDWHEHQRWVKLSGGPVNVIELGEGPPLVFVHGHSGRWANWLEQLPSFARTHRVVAMDLPGFGSSPMPREPISIENYGRFLDELMDRLDIAAAPVVGNSMGGFAAGELAIKFPPPLERLGPGSAAGPAPEEPRFSTGVFPPRAPPRVAPAGQVFA